jgi:hypothetical protein
MPEQDAPGELRPRALYRADYREALCKMILHAVDMGVKIPDDMPVDTPEHIKMAIVYVGRLTSQHSRDTCMSVW